MSAELVKVTIDGRELQVPKGAGMVETALDAGIEIPVFCYEPRLGPPLGACRMCLCEVEGLPKLQAACTLTAQDGMILRTAQTSEKARFGQDAVLEFILLNHPLDCPDCDKGGECPLQDLTFRYGPPTTRMTFPKRTLDKPIPVSPTIALDRERCILCYRCTRFSEEVAEDGQLVAIERGSHTMIATFEDEPYRAHFSGNVVELCPVGALTSTVYRFRARPWEIQNVPTVCGLCPVGCNVWATTREGKVVRMLSRNHPEVDEGWICDKGRFAHDHLRADDRISEPLARRRLQGLVPATLDEVLDAAEEGLRAAHGRVAVAFSGAETVEQATAIASLVRRGLGSDLALLPDDTDPALEAFRAPLSAIRSSQVCLVVGDEPVVERAPVVDLWLRAARRAGAEIVSIHPAGSITVPPGSAAAVCAALGSDAPPEELRGIAGRLREAERVSIVYSEDDPAGGRRAAALASAIGGDGIGVYYLPRTPNGRGVAAAWRAAGGGRGREPSPEDELGALIVSGDEATADPRVLELAGRAGFVISTSMFMTEVTGWSHVVVPGTSYLEREGTTVNLEGRAQRQRRASAPPAGFDELELFARLAQRFGLDVSPWPDVGVADRASLPARAGASPVEAPPAPSPAASGERFALVRYRPLFTGAAVERVPQLQFQRPAPEVELAHGDGRGLGVRTGDRVVVSSNGTSRELTARLNRRLRAGVVRVAAPHAEGLGSAVEVTKA